MKVKLESKQFFIFEILIIVFIWSISFFVSKGSFGRPLDTHHEWLSAQVLVSLRAFEERGFWELLGASILVPNTPEFMNIDISSLTKSEGIYLSYPSFYLVLPYLMFKISNLFSSNISFSVEYLQLYNLVVNRFLGGVFVYHILLETIFIISKSSWPRYLHKLLAFSGLIGWLFAPPVLYWTQNSYFSDQAVLLPIYIIFLISIKCKFKFYSLSIPLKVILFLSTLIACGTDWYGWVAVAAIMFITLIDVCIDQSWQMHRAFKVYIKNTCLFVLGILSASAFFIGQLFYYRDGFKQIYEIFLKRTGSTMLDDRGNEISSQISFIKGIVSHWSFYYPKTLQDWVYKPSFVNHAIVLFLAILFISLSLYFFYRRNHIKRLVLYIYALVYLVPLLQLYILKQHSLIHDFSAFKMALPIAFSIFVLPPLLLGEITDSLLKNLSGSKTSNWRTFFLCSLITVLGSTFIINSNYQFKAFADAGSSYYLDLGNIVNKEISTDKITIANHDLLAVDLKEDNLGSFPAPPQIYWYANRYIYKPEQLKRLINQSKVNIEVVTNMEPVFLAYEDQEISLEINEICSDKWIHLPGRIEGKKLIICEESELKSLYLE